MTVDPKRVFGPNFKRLVIHKMAHDAIPDGGGFADGLKFITNPATIRSGWLAAQEWCEAAVKSVRDAQDPNQWKSSTEEDICAELLRMIDLRKSAVGKTTATPKE